MFLFELFFFTLAEEKNCQSRHLVVLVIAGYINEFQSQQILAFCYMVHVLVSEGIELKPEDKAVGQFLHEQWITKEVLLPFFEFRYRGL